MSHSLLRQYADAPFEVATLGGSAGAEGARPKFVPSPRGLARGRRGGKRERGRAPETAAQGLKSLPAARLGEGSKRGRDKVKTFAPGEC